ncbi:MAG: autotransporter domain-containing protein, partial [Methylovirgula sp.]
GANTYSGATTINGGTLKGGAANAFSAASATTINTGGTLDLGSAAQTINAVDFAGGTLQNGSLTGAITSTGGTINGIGGSATLTTSSGTTTLEGANTYSGATTINGGTLKGGAANAFSAASATTINTGGTLDLGSFAQTINAVDLAGGTLQNGSLTGAITSTGGTISAIGGSATLTTSSGTTTLESANTYSGATAVNGGTLKGGAANAFSAASATTINTGGTLDLGSAAQTINAVDLAGGTLQNGFLTGAVTSSGGSVSAKLVGASTLINTSGTTTLSNANSYTGATTINSGATLALSGGSISSSSVVTANGTFDLTGATATTAITTLAGSGSVVLGTSYGLFVTTGSTEFSGAISGGGGLEIGSGTQTLSGTNTYTNETQIDSGATLALKGAGSIAASSSVAASGTFDISQTTAGASVAGVYGSGTVSLGAQTLTIGNAGTFFDGVIQDGGIAGGTGGGVTIAAGGSQQLGGTNTYTGITTINKTGELDLIANGGFNGSIATARAVVNNGIFDISDLGHGSTPTSTSIISLSGASTGTVYLGENQLTLTNASGTYAGVIADGGNDGGTGGKLKITSGTQTLSGTNTYTGGTTLTAGTLVVGNDSALGTGTLSMAPGTTLSFANTGNFSIANAIKISGDPTFTPAAGTVQTITGVISDGSSPGTIEMAGAGTLVLSGTNTYTGPTNVDAGTLQVDGSIASSSLTTVNNGGKLTGSGTLGSLQINAGGIFGPGVSGNTATVLTVNGNLTLNAGSTYAIAISPTQSSKTQVNGTATLGGATVAATVTGSYGLYTSRSYTILTATKVSGTFSPSVTISSSGLTSAEKLVMQGAAGLSYDSIDAFLGLALPTYAITLALPSYAPFNATNAAGAINHFILAGGTLPSGFQTLATLSGNALSAAVNQLAGQAGGSFVQGGFMAGDMFLNMVLNPFVEGRDGADGFGAATASAPAPALAYAPEDALTQRANAAFSAFMPEGRRSSVSQLSFWGGSYGGSGTIDGNATTGAATVTSQVYGFAAGVDDHVAPDMILGFALGGGGTNWGLDQGMGGGHSSMVQTSLYGSKQFGPAYVSGALAYSWHDVTTTRSVSLAGFDTLNANFGANVVSSRLEAGYRLPSGVLPFGAMASGRFGVTPYAALEAQAMVLPAFSEWAGPGSSAQFALNYNSRTYTTTRTELGAWLTYDLPLANQALKLYSRFAYAHDFNNEGIATAFFQELPGANFLINTAKPAANDALVTAGIEYRLIDGWSVLGKFDGEFSSTTEIYAGTGVIQKVW